MPKRPPTHAELKRLRAGTRRSRDQRPCAARRGYGRRWQRLRRLVLQRDPFCVMCRHALATEVDHIVPKSRGGRDSLDNLQGLCKPCHSEKTVREDGGFGR